MEFLLRKTAFNLQLFLEFFKTFNFQIINIAVDIIAS